MKMNRVASLRLSVLVVILAIACSSSRDLEESGPPGPACVEDEQAPPSYSLSQGLALERAFIQAGRRDAGLDTVHGAVSPELLVAADALRSELVETAAADNGFTLPIDDGAPLGPGSCAGQTYEGLSTTSQAASGSSWFTFGIAYMTLLEAAKMAPFEGSIGKEPYTKEADGTAADGTPAHFSTTVHMTLTGQGSKVSTVAQISTTITTANGSSTESASTGASIDVCPDIGGLAIGTFKLTADGSTSAGATYHVVADQKFSIVVNDAAETIGIDFAGTMSYVSTGPNPNQLTLVSDMGFTLGSYDPAYSNGLWQATNGSADNQALVRDYYVTFAKVMADAIEPEAKKKWRGGTCIEVLIDRPSSNVQPQEQVHVLATAHHKIEDKDLPEPIVATLAGPASLSPQTPVDGPGAPFDYVAGIEGESGTVTFTSTSRRGIGTTQATYTVGCGIGNGVFECIDGKVAGLPCKYVGTSSVTDITGRKFTANVTLTATHFEGCSVAYQPSGTVTLTPGSADVCTYTPLTVTMSGTNTHGKMVISLGTPLLVADFGTDWTIQAQCGTSPPVPGPMAGIWLLATGAPVVPGEPLVGSSPLPGLTSTWNLVPQ
jgi:hypothetical protein